MSSLTQALIERKIRAVIFDLDDTLYPEIQYVQSGFKAVSRKIEEDFGADCYDLLLSLFCENSANVYNRALDCLGVPYSEAYIRELVAVYRAHKPQNLRFYPDVLPFLTTLKDLGIAVGILTDGRVEGQKNKLEALRCYELFDCILITDALGGERYRKPSKAAFERMCADLHLSFAQIAYIGDNPAKDFYIGTEGVFTVRIKRENALNFGGEQYYKGVRENLLTERLSEEDG